VFTASSMLALHCTQSATHHLLLLCRWMAADLYLREVDILRFEVSTRSITHGREGYVQHHMQGDGAHMSAGAANSAPTTTLARLHTTVTWLRSFYNTCQHGMCPLVSACVCSFSCQ
jgi:hypothetical protein